MSEAAATLTILCVGALEAAIEPLANARHADIRACTFRGAARTAADMRNLNFLHLSRQDGTGDWDIEESCAWLAIAARVHPNKPGIVIEDPDLYPLAAMFKKEGITVYCMPLPDAVAQYLCDRQKAAA